MVWVVSGEPNASEYHVYRGAISDLWYPYFGTCRDDSGADRTEQTLTDTEQPPQHAGFFYLITAKDSGGSEGTLGLAHCAERSNFTPCP